MTHARTTLPAVSPVHAAIAAHRAAYDAFQIAPEGKASEHASDAYDEANMAVVAVACATTPRPWPCFGIWRGGCWTKPSTPPAISPPTTLPWRERRI